MIGLARATTRAIGRRLPRHDVTGRCLSRVCEWVLFVADPRARRFTAYVLDRAELDRVSHR